MKEGRRVKSWKRRYFVLRGGKLSYFKNENKNENDLKGSMEIEGCEAKYIGQRTDDDNPNAQDNEEDGNSSEEEILNSRSSIAVTPTVKKDKSTTDVTRYRYKCALK